MTSVTVRNIPLQWENEREHRRILARNMQDMLAGAHNACGNVTLTANAATTTKTDPRVSPASRILFMPLTSNAAQQLYGGTMYVSSRGQGTFTITHANNAQTDREYDYAILGQ